MIKIPVYTTKAKLQAAAVLICITLAMAAALDFSGFLGPYDLKTMDLMFRRVPLPPASPDIALIAIDQADIDFFQEQGVGWPWPRELYGPIIDFCRRGRAKAVVFDMLYTENSIYGKEDDQKLAQAARESGQVFFPFFLSQNIKESHGGENEILAKSSLSITGPAPFFAQKFQSILAPIPPLVAAARGLGNVECAPDADGVFRRLPLVVPFQNRWLPMLTFAAFQLARPAEPWKFQDGALVQGDLRIPLDQEGRLLLKFRGPSRTHRRYSAANVIQSEVCLQHGQPPIYPPENLNGKWVLIGATAPGLLDLKPSPLAPVYPGVELHATLLDNLLQGDFFQVVPAWLQWLWTIALTIGIVVLVLLANRLWLVLSGLGLFVLLHLGTATALFSKGWLLAGVGPLTSVGLAFVLTAAFSYATEGRQKLAIRTMFSRYMSEDVINHLLAHPEEVRLGGERRRLTLFFSDLAGFTTLSESLEPEVVVQLLNEYLSAMTEIILAEQGTVDKYEGDAIMAFWGAPLALADHALRACRTALRQQAALTDLNARFQVKGWPPLHCRIGLHTGEAVVGNLGSDKRFDYTVIGDTVNLASRLEGLNKFYGTAIMASETTVQECQGALEFLELDWVAVKGRETPVRVFQALAFKGELTSSQEQARRAFGQGLARYRQGLFVQAGQAFQQSLEYWPEYAPSREFLRRCREQEAGPTPGQWDAVFRPDKK
jgi:adenylate cyclase